MTRTAHWSFKLKAHSWLKNLFAIEWNQILGYIKSVKNSQNATFFAFFFFKFRIAFGWLKASSKQIWNLDWKIADRICRSNPSFEKSHYRQAQKTRAIFLFLWT